MKLLTLIIIVGTLAPLAWPVTFATPAERLRAAETAGERCSYRSTLVCSEMRATTTVTAQVTVNHRPGATRWDYLSPALKGTAVIENGETLIRLDSRNQTATIAQVPRKPSRLDLLLTNYTVAAAGTASVAGRPAEILEIHRRHPRQLCRRLWLDQEYQLILRAENYDRQGRLRSSSECQTIEWKPQLKEALFQIPPGWQVTTSTPTAHALPDAAALRQAAGFAIPMPDPPASFVLEEMAFQPCPCGNPAVQLRYVDGLESISLFIKPTRCQGGGRGPGMGLGMGRGLAMGKGPGAGRGRGWVGEDGEPASGPRQSHCACERVTALPGQTRVKAGSVLTYILVGDLSETEWEHFASTLP